LAWRFPSHAQRLAGKHDNPPSRSPTSSATNIAYSAAGSNGEPMPDRVLALVPDISSARRSR
jgi:hypothetical protein